MSSKARGNQGGAMDRRQVLGIMISLSVLPLAACKTGGVHVAVGMASSLINFSCWRLRPVQLNKLLRLRNAEIEIP